MTGPVPGWGIRKGPIYTSLYECPRGYPFRLQTNWDWHGRRWLDQPPDYFFHKGARTFLEYLQATCLGFKPPSDPSEPFDLGGPPLF